MATGGCKLRVDGGQYVDVGAADDVRQVGEVVDVLDGAEAPPGDVTGQSVVPASQQDLHHFVIISITCVINNHHFITKLMLMQLLVIITCCND